MPPTSYRDSPAEDKNLVPRHPILAVLFVAFPCIELWLMSRIPSAAGGSGTGGGTLNSASFFFFLSIGAAYLAGLIAALTTNRTLRISLLRSIVVLEILGWLTCSLLAPGKIAGHVLFGMLLYFAAALVIPGVLWAWMFAKNS